MCGIDQRKSMSKISSVRPYVSTELRIVTDTDWEFFSKHSVFTLQAATSLRSVPARRRSSWIMYVITMSVVIACVHLKHNSCHTWPVADTKPICVELLGHSRQTVTGRLATHPSNTAVKIKKIQVSICIFMIFLYTNGSQCRPM